MEFLILILVATFSFVAVIVWTTQRRKERESLYYHETIRKVAELHGAQAVLDYMRETDRLKAHRIGNGLTLGGIVAIFGGAALTIFLWMAVIVPGGHPTTLFFLIGLIPVLVGVGLVVYSLVFAPGKKRAS